MKVYVIIFLPLFLLSGLFISYSYGHRNSSPNMECISCHEGEMVPEIVKIDGIPQSYVPGKTYTMTVIVKSGLESMSESKGGFSLEVSAGKLLVKDKKNTQLINGFLTHTQEGNELRRWVFQWRAPSEKTDVVLTVMAVAANGDYSPAGDIVGAMSYSIKPSTREVKK